MLFAGLSGEENKVFVRGLGARSTANVCMRLEVEHVSFAKHDFECRRHPSTFG